MKLQPIVFVLAAGVSSCIGNLALKRSRFDVAPEAEFFATLINPYFVLGLFFYAVNVVLFVKALDGMAVSVAYPVLAGSGFALLALASAWLFAEHLDAGQLIGIALIVSGILLLARPTT